MLTLALTLAAVAQEPALPLAGRWTARLLGPGGPIPFHLELERGDGRWRAALVNGPERRAIERVEATGGRLVLHVDPYDSRLEARVAEGGRALAGEWVRERGPGAEPTRMTFEAEHGGGPRFTARAPDPAAARALAGRWRVDFESSEDPAVGLFSPRAGGIVDGTFLTTLGDYRYLEGALDGRTLRLSVFDGAHAFLFTAALGEDGRLAGDFWSRDSWHETWTAVRDPEAALPDPFGLTTWTGEVPLEELAFPDVNGRVRSLADPAFAGRARLFVLFGTWCPNCYDLSHYLVELHRRYADRGLAIVGLAFELGDDRERNGRVLRRYADHHGIRYPLLIAGTSDKAQASRAFPALDRVRAFPTTVFLGAGGEVEAVHTGFSGPATGAAHERLRERFEALIEELLARG